MPEVKQWLKEKPELYRRSKVDGVVERRACGLTVGQIRVETEAQKELDENVIVVPIRG